MERLDRLAMEMIAFDAGDPKRIQHFLKVHSLARLIAAGEGMTGRERLVLEAAALTHDIGIHPAEQKYGRCDGKLQEREGPPVARAMLERLGFSPQETDRVGFLIGRHHTYEGVDSLDWRILLEADMLVNLYEKQRDRAAVAEARRRVFATRTGIRLLGEMFG